MLLLGMPWGTPTAGRGTADASIQSNIMGNIMVAPRYYTYFRE